MSDIAQFVKERNAALLSLDKQIIDATFAKYGTRLPTDEVAYWGGVHKARLEIVEFDEETKEISRQWLREHGMKTLMGDQP